MTKKVKKSKKHVKINNQGPFFGWFYGQVIDSGVRVHMGTLGLVWGTVGGQKWPKMSPRSITIWENEKNEPNSQTKSVFWLVAVGIHETMGISPYGDHGGTLRLRKGSKNLKKPQKTTKKVKKLKKHVRINNQGPFFGWFHGQVIDSGVRVHMGTLGLV